MAKVNKVATEGPSLRRKPRSTIREGQAPSITIKEYTDTIFRQRERAEDQLADERELRYTQLRAADQRAIEAALLAGEKYQAAVVAASKEAINKAEVATEKRFEGVNEFRNALNDATGKQIPRAEFQQAMQTINEKIDDLKGHDNNRTGSSQAIENGWKYLLAAGGLLLSTLLAMRAFGIIQ